NNQINARRSLTPPSLNFPRTRVIGRNLARCALFNPSMRAIGPVESAYSAKLRLITRHSHERETLTLERTQMKTILVPFKTVSLVAASIFALAVTARANFDWENLEGDIPGVAEITDSNVINPWGIAVSSSRSEEHTSELQSLAYLVCRLL